MAANPVWQPSNLFLARLAAALIAHAQAGPVNGTLDVLFMGLFQAPTPALGQNNVMADITPANYTGYARQAIAWYPPYIDSAGPQTLESSSLHFQPTDGVVPNVITGVFVADALVAGNLLLSASLAGGPIPMANALAALTVQAVFQLAFGQQYGGPVVRS